MGGPWLRLYTEIRRDRKLRRLPPAQRWLWVTILAMAKESPRPGLLLLSDGVPVTEEDLADEAFITREEVDAGLQAFKEQRMLDLSEGVWHLVNWDKRQFVSDSSTDRVQRFREKKDETLLQRFDNVTETPPDTETDTNTEIGIKEDPPLPSPPPSPADPGKWWGGGILPSEPGVDGLGPGWDGDVSS